MDRDQGHTRYPLIGEGAATVFVIDEATGNIHVTRSLGQEGKAQYVLLAQAADQTTNWPPEPPSEFIIKMQDVSNNPPTFLLGPYHGTMSNVGKKKPITSQSGFCFETMPPFFFWSTAAL